MGIEINNLTKYRIDRKSFSQLAKKVLKGENRVRETISLVFVSKKEIKKLNKKFRKKNRPTDVLSFTLNDPLTHKATEGQRKNLPAQAGYLGEIVICPEVVKENSRKYKVGFNREIIKVFVHGILHLCGYDHEKSERDAKVMEKKQEKYLTNS